MSDKKLQHERLARYLDVAVPRGDRRWGNAEIEIILKAIDLERAVVEAESADTKWHFNASAPVPVPSFNFDLTDEQLAKIAEDHHNQPLHVASEHPYAATLPLTAPPATPSAESFSGDGTEPVAGSEDGASDAKASSDVIERAAQALHAHDQTRDYGCRGRSWGALGNEGQETFRNQARALAALRLLTPSDTFASTKSGEEATQRLARAAFMVDGTHHFWVDELGRPVCLCGFTGNARKRTQTEHITSAVLEAFDHD